MGDSGIGQTQGMETQERNRGTGTGRPSRRYVLDGGPGTAGTFRRLAARAAADWYGPLSPSARTAVADAQLLVTELVVDAVRRGGAPTSSASTAPPTAYGSR
ncbi:hypothetical protein [Streptomyces roseolus]|uniref:hypothetical protein n=1 Tax=Streptomyces roseolus TaxID=67358 RepID=UPI0036EFAA53